MASIIYKVFFCQNTLEGSRFPKSHDSSKLRKASCHTLAEVSDKLFALQMSSSLLHRQSLPLRSLEDHPMVTLVHVPVNKKL